MGLEVSSARAPQSTLCISRTPKPFPALPMTGLRCGEVDRPSCQPARKSALTPSIAFVIHVVRLFRWDSGLKNPCGYSDGLSGHGFNRAESDARATRLQPLRFVVALLNVDSRVLERVVIPRKLQETQLQSPSSAAERVWVDHFSPGQTKGELARLAQLNSK